MGFDMERLARMDELTFSQVSAVLKLDPETGKLFWRERPHSMFSDNGRGVKANALVWNDRFAGHEAFTTVTEKGYRRGIIFNRKYRAHRVVWLLHTGFWPTDQIDHVNGDRSDNRVANLRQVTGAENNRNTALNSLNTSGICGVSWHRRTGKWRAEIQINRKKIHLGLFDNQESAAIARAEANARYEFSSRHGEPA